MGYETAFDVEAKRLLRLHCEDVDLGMVTRLGLDLFGISDEQGFGLTMDDAVDARHAADVLRRRIGGWHHLESYMRCLVK